MPVVEGRNPLVVWFLAARGERITESVRKKKRRRRRRKLASELVCRNLAQTKATSLVSSSARPLHVAAAIWKYDICRGEREPRGRREKLRARARLRERDVIVRLTDLKKERTKATITHCCHVGCGTSYYDRTHTHNAFHAWAKWAGRVSPLLELLPVPICCRPSRALSACRIPLAGSGVIVVVVASGFVARKHVCVCLGKGGGMADARTEERRMYIVQKKKRGVCNCRHTSVLQRLLFTRQAQLWQKLRSGDRWRRRRQHEGRRFPGFCTKKCSRIGYYLRLSRQVFFFLFGLLSSSLKLAVDCAPPLLSLLTLDNPTTTAVNKRERGEEELREECLFNDDYDDARRLHLPLPFEALSLNQARSLPPRVVRREENHHK